MQAVAAIVRVVWLVAMASAALPSLRAASPDTKFTGASGRDTGGVLVQNAAAHLQGTNLPPTTNTSYILTPNDLIKVEVYKEPDLLRQTRIDQDGTISLPLIETVRVGGKTIAEARAMIRSLYEKDYLVSAGVDIAVLTSARTNVVEAMKPKTFKYTVSGQVRKPGIIEFKDGEKVTLVEAILQAGDFTGIANKNKVSILRQEGGAQKVYIEDVEAMLINPKSKQFTVMPGDVISVKQTIF